MNTNRRRSLQCLTALVGASLLSACGGGGGGGGDGSAAESSAGNSTARTLTANATEFRTFEPIDLRYNTDIDPAITRFEVHYPDTDEIVLLNDNLVDPTLIPAAPIVTRTRQGTLRALRNGAVTHEATITIHPIPTSGSPGDMMLRFIDAALDSSAEASRSAQQHDPAAVAEASALVRSLRELRILVTDIRTNGAITLGNGPDGKRVVFDRTTLLQMDQVAGAMSNRLERRANKTTLLSHGGTHGTDCIGCSTGGTGSGSGGNAGSGGTPSGSGSGGGGIGGAPLSVPGGGITPTPVRRPPAPTVGQPLPPSTPFRPLPPNAVRWVEPQLTYEQMVKTLSDAEVTAGWMNITGEFAMAAVGAMAIAGSVTPPGAVIAALAIAGAVIVVQAHSIILKYRYGRPSGFDITDETGAIISTSVGALLTVNGRAAKLTESLRKAAGAPSVPVIPGRHGELVKKTIDNMQETVVGKAAGDLSQEAFRVLPLCGNPSQRRNIDCVDRR